MTSETSSLLDYQRRLQRIVIQHQRPFLRDEKLSAESATQEVYTEFKAELSEQIRQIGSDFPIYIASFRSRRGVSETFLRTLHSDPHQIASIFNDPQDASSFEFRRGSFEDLSGTQPIKYFDDQLEYECLVKPFLLEKCITSNYPTDQKRFPHRVRSFIEKPELSGVLDKQTLEKISDVGTCIVFGRIGRKHKESDRLDDLVALYSSEKLEAISPEFGKLICRLISITLTAFSQIERFDKEEFRRSTMTRITELVPHFSDKLMAPATNVSMLIDGLTKSFEQHPYFGTSTQADDVAVRFVKLDFTRENAENRVTNGGKQNEVLLPRLSIYPPAFANIVPENATYFSHKSSRSVVKFLLGKWADMHRWKVGKKPYRFSDAFKATYEFGSDGKDLPQNSEKGPIWWPLLKEGKRKEVRGIYANRLRDDRFWKSHNFTAQPGERPFVTTAAFLLKQARRSEKSVRDGLELPFGILAFESKVPDAFSPEDLKILEEISEAVAHLIDLNGWSEVHVDYSTLIQDAILETRFGKELGPRSRIAFHLQRADLKTLKLWTDGVKNPAKVLADAKKPPEQLDSIWARGFRGMLDVFELSGNHSAEDFVQVLQNISAFFYAHREVRGRGKNVTYGWKRNPLDILAEDHRQFEADHEHEKQTLEFLESIPSSEEWHARFSAIPRALLTRELTDPTFTNFPTGFSANAIYVLDDVNEIRQILKFSDRESIKKERENYQTFVRYHTPLAARMPTDGFAVDNDGSTQPPNPKERAELQAEERKGYGVLVSDLVAGSKDVYSTSEGKKDDGIPHSLQEFLYSFYSNKPFKDTKSASGIDADHRMEKLEQFLQAITHHFRSKATKWESPRNRSFGKQFGSWLEAEMEFDIKKVILDSSRLEQISDANQPQKYFDPTNPFGSGVKPCRQSEEEVFEYFTNCASAFEKSIDDHEGFHELVTNALGYDRGINLGGRDTALGDTPNLCELLNVAKIRFLEDLEGISSSDIEPLLAVIHGDSHGRNLTWSDAFKQFQMIDFENVRFGYIFSDQIKLAVSVLTQILSSNLSELDERSTLEDGLCEDFEEAIIALTFFARSFRRKHDGLGEILEESFFRRPFRKSDLRDLEKLNDMREAGDISAEEVKKKVLEYKKTNHASGDLTRVLRRIFGSSFDLPDIKSTETHDLNTILTTIPDVKDLRRGTDEQAFRGTYLAALKAFGLKEFSYHLRSLTDRDLTRLKMWNKIYACMTGEMSTTELISMLSAEEWGLSGPELDGLRRFGRERDTKFAKFEEKARSDGEYSEAEMQEAFNRISVKDFCKLVLSLFPRSEASLVHPDEKVASLASACFVLLSVNMYSLAGR